MELYIRAINVSLNVNVRPICQERRWIQWPMNLKVAWARWDYVFFDSYLFKPCIDVSGIKIPAFLVYLKHKQWTTQRCQKQHLLGKILNFAYPFWCALVYFPESIKLLKATSRGHLVWWVKQDGKISYYAVSQSAYTYVGAFHLHKITSALVSSEFFS